MSHTPGPWSIKRSPVMHDGEYDFAINAEGAPILAEAFGRSSDGGYPPAEANARLIAAAPDLLEAAKTAYEWMNCLPIPTTGCTAKMQILFDAIAKATSPTLPVGGSDAARGSLKEKPDQHAEAKAYLDSRPDRDPTQIEIDDDESCGGFV